MRPTSLEQAVQFIREEDNIKYYQKGQSYTNSANKNNPNLRKPIHNSIQYQNNSRSPPNYRPQYSTYQVQQPSTPNYQPQPSYTNFPRGPVQIPKHPNPPNPSFPTTTQVFGKPQNVWKPNPKAIQPTPTPMSVSTRNTNPQLRNRNYNYFQNHGQKPNFISEELFNTELIPEETQYDSDVNQNEVYFEYENNDEIVENFQDVDLTADTT